MKKISVVYYSGYGHTNNLSKAIVCGDDVLENMKANPIAIDQDSETAKAFGIRIATVVSDLLR
ncbi:MAG: hypothetical protein QNJ78_00315 [Gammaproteobacteria bacterium]|nr:hypothetical protein [Gammaproteobacteria bacterium]